VPVVPVHPSVSALGVQLHLGADVHLAMTLPRLRIVPAHRAELLQYFEEMMGSLPRYFELQDAEDGADLAAARGVAAKLEGVVQARHLTF